MMRVKVGLILLLLGIVALLSLPALKIVIAKKELPAIVPLPQHIDGRKGSFVLTPETRIVSDPLSRQTSDYLAERLRRSTGYGFPVSFQSNSSGSGPHILITKQGAKEELGEEGYELTVSTDSVSLRAPADPGLFCGVQTLLQLLPPDIFATHVVHSSKWRMPCVHIEDKPRFAWRGVMLDVSRHFFNKGEVKKLLDAMALHKLNTFHWHLTDDQGWRIEIKKYPRLTDVGAWRNKIGFNLDPKSTTAYGPDDHYGGYYTQSDIREIVAYALSRHITIVPEIEMPGHASAALAAYPEFSCSGGPYFTDMNLNTSAGVFCAGKDATFEFLQNVLSEVIELFPGKYIHVGGDEVPKQNWKDCEQCQARLHREGLKNEHELQSYFIRRIDNFIAAKGRTLIGWSEIREGGLPPQAAIMDWIGGAVKAASSGHDVVMSPDAFCYFDFYQSRNRSTEPPAVGAHLPLEKVYSFEPVPANLAPQFQRHILGAQGNVWTEYMPSLRQVEYMTFPRLCALAEVVWSPKSSRSWEDFVRRLRTHMQRLDQLGIEYRKGSWNEDNSATIIR